ncbi:hypothetical protein UPYG_G00274540 [Umbra pygmaea]|uniref:CCR4-NOT transcription complex subunit 4 n=1 Tax=Umbra pygmaea TaxID=75934 RepID=A0ABD0WJS8_UMBPY
MSSSPEVREQHHVELPMECPLCLEPLEIDDVNFFPCTCGYQICRFCWHRIRTDENGLCPACRKPYPEDPAVYKPLSAEELQRIKNEKKAKQVEKKQKITENRKQLSSVRVVQRNLVFVVGLSQRLADPEVLKRPEYFGKFGKIHKVVINNSTSYAGSQGPSASAYVTYLRSEDALRAIQCVNNVVVDGRTLKASLGTTKYCSYFLKSMQCPKPDCMYLHELGDEAASFTKEEMQAGKHQEYEQKLLQDLYKNPVFTTQTSGAEKTKSSKPSSLQRSNSNSSHGQEAWPSLQPIGKMANGLSSESPKSPPLDGGESDSEHMTPDRPDCDMSLGPGSSLSGFSSCDPSSDVLPDIISSSITQHGLMGNGDTSEHHNLLPNCDSPSPPPVLSGPPGFSKPSLNVPMGVACLTARSPFEGAAAESQSLFSDNSNFRHPNPMSSSLPGFPNIPEPHRNHQDSWPTAPEPHRNHQDSWPTAPEPHRNHQDSWPTAPESHRNHQDSWPTAPEPHRNHQDSWPTAPEPHRNHQDSWPTAPEPHRNHQDSWPTAPEPHSLFSSDTIPVSSSTDWQAAFGFGSSKQQTSEDDLGFDPFDITRKALADLIEKELSVQDGLPAVPTGPFPTHHAPPSRSSVPTKPAPPGGLLSQNQPFSHLRHHAPSRACYSTFSFSGQPSSSSSSNAASRHPWMTSSAALGAVPSRNNFTTHFGNHSTSASVAQHSSFLDLMLPTMSSMQHHSTGLGGLAMTGLPSSASSSLDSLQDDNPPHWLKSLQSLTESLTEMDAPPLPSSSPQQPPIHSSHSSGLFGGGQVPLQHRSSWAPYQSPDTGSHAPHPGSHFHSPPPGFQTAFRAPAQTATDLLQTAGMDRH